MKIILLWLKATGLTLEWTVKDRTFQFTGLPAQAGFWERFFPPQSGMDHPTRRTLSESEAQQAFESGSSFVLYSSRKDEEGAESLTREAVLAKVEADFPGVTKLGQ